MLKNKFLGVIFGGALIVGAISFNLGMISLFIISLIVIFITASTAYIVRADELEQGTI